MSMQIIKPGLLSSFQDLGRHGNQHIGITVCGACDPYALQLANILVGNESQSACLEITLIGPELVFNRDALIAITGANLNPHLDGQAIAINRPIIVLQGQRLSFSMSANNTGMRSYLAVAGGFSLNTFLNSDSTYLKGQLGGYQGRALKADDVITFKQNLAISPSFKRYIAEQKIYLSSKLGLGSKNKIRVTKGPHWSLFTAESRNLFKQEPFVITPQSERMGFRLKGPSLSLSSPKQILSEPTSFGTVQVPVDGNPIILMADRQTTGGYPKIGAVSHIDLSLLAQLRFGEKFTFELIDLASSQKLLYERHQAFKTLADQLSALRAAIHQQFQTEQA